MSDNTIVAMSVTETAKRLGVADRTVLRWLEQGEFPNAYQLAPQPKSPYRIPVGDIEDFERRRKSRK